VLLCSRGQPETRLPEPQGSAPWLPASGPAAAITLSQQAVSLRCWALELQMLSAAAKQHGVTIVGGSVPERSQDRLYNTCCVYGPDGKLLAKHR